MLKHHPYLALLGLTALLAACSATSTPTPGLTQGVRGTVVSGRAGEALAGATVQAVSNGQVVASTTTDSGGNYSFSLTAGTYTVTSPGQTLSASVNQGGTGQVPFASSTVTGVTVSDQNVTSQNLIQLPAVAASNPSTPPSVSVSGVAAQLDAQGTFSPAVHIETQGNSVYRVVVGIGQDPAIYGLGRTDRSLIYNGGPSGESAPTTSVDASPSSPLSVARFAAGLSGSTSVEVMAVDSNNDRTLALIPVQITNVPAGNSLSAAVGGVNAVAYTVSNTRLHLQSAGAGALTYVNVSWTPYAFPVAPTATSGNLNQGYRILRSLNGGPLTQVGSVAVYATTAGGKTTVVNPGVYQDTSPALKAGDQVSYVVRAFDGQQTTPDSTPTASATLLAPLSVTLTAPSENAQDTSLTPTFTWTTNGVGAQEYFVPAVGDVVQGGAVFCGAAPTAQPATPLEDLLQGAGLSSGRGFPFSGTRCGVVSGASGGQFTYTPTSQSTAAFMPPLQEHRAYQWRLLEAVATDNASDPHALSVFSDDAGLLFKYNIYTGLYTFDGDQVLTFTTGGSK